MKKTTNDGYIISNYAKPCIVCGKLTHKFEYCYEAFICGYECENILNEELKKQN